MTNVISSRPPLKLNRSEQFGVWVFEVYCVGFEQRKYWATNKQNLHASCSFFLPKHKRVPSQTWRELQFLQSMPLTEQLAFVQTAPYVMRISRTKTAQHPKNQHGPAQTRLPYLHKKDVFQSQFPFCVNMLIFSDFKPGNTNRTRMISPCIRPPLRRTPAKVSIIFPRSTITVGCTYFFWS